MATHGRLARPSRSTAAYAGLVGVLVGARAVFTVVPTDVPLASQSATLSWPAVVALAVAGAVGLAAARRTAIATPGVAAPRWSVPDADRSVLDRRHLEPVAAGIGFAVAFAALDLAVPLGIPHVAFPHAVPFYLYGAVATELLFRLVPISVAVWLVARVRPGRRWQAGTFAATAALTALVEPFGLVEVVAPGGAVLVLVVGLTYALNLVGAALLWRYGLLAAVLERAAFYLGWHVAYGGLG